MEGRGIMHRINGDRYEGEFKDDKMEGKGKMFYNKNDTSQREIY